MTSKRKLIESFIVIGILTVAIFGVGVQVGYTWSGTWNTLSENYLEVPNANITNVESETIDASYYYWNDENRSDVLAYPEQEASYVVFKLGSTYKAKNCSTGQLDYSGTNATSVWESVRDSGLTSGRTWKEAVVFKGNIAIDSTIIIPNYTRVIIQGKIRLEDGSNCNIIKNIDQTNGNIEIEIIGEIDGNADGQTSNGLVGIDIQSTTPIDSDLKLDVHVHDVNGTGIHIKRHNNVDITALVENCGSTGISTHHNIYIHTCEQVQAHLTTSGCVAGKNIKFTNSYNFSTYIITHDSALEGVYFGGCRFFEATGISYDNGLHGVRVNSEGGTSPFAWKVDFTSFSNTGDGLYISGGSNGRISGTYRGNSDGIELADSDKNLIIGCQIRDNTKGIVESGSSDSNHIIGNILTNQNTPLTIIGSNTRVRDNLGHDGTTVDWVNATSGFYLNSVNITDRLEGNYSEEGLAAPWIELGGTNRTTWPSGTGGNPFDQSLNTTDAPTFANVTTDGVDVDWIDLGGVNRTSWPGAGSSTGSFPYSYLVFKNATSIYMVSGSTGLVEWDNSDITNILDACVGNLSDGGRIHIRAGTYLFYVNHAVESNIMYTGEGYATHLKLADNRPHASSSDYDHWIIFTGSGGPENVTIKGIRFDGNKASNDVCSPIVKAIAPIYISGLRNSELTECYFVNHAVCGININGYVQDAYGNQIHHNYFANNGWNQVVFSSGTYGVHDNEVTHNYMTGTIGDISITCYALSGKPHPYNQKFNFNTIDGMNGYNGSSDDSDPSWIGIKFERSYSCQAIGNVIRDVRVGIADDSFGDGNHTVKANWIYVKDSPGSNLVYAIYANRPRWHIEGNKIWGPETDNSHGIYLHSTNHNSTVIGNYASERSGASGSMNGITDQGTDNYIFLNDVENCDTPINYGGSGATIKYNKGYVTENEGTATISSGTTSETVSHGCDYTPSAGDINVHPIESLGSASFFWVDTITSTQFTINVDANPTQDVDFAWSVDA